MIFLTSAPANAQWAEEWWFQPFGIQQAQASGVTGAGITVAVVDSGVVDTIGDLRGQVDNGVDVTGGGNAKADPGEGCNTYGGCFSHGTNMALLIAGTGKGAGMLGVAPGARIYPVKMGSSGFGKAGTESTLTAGILAAAKSPAQIINVSVGSDTTCSPTEAAAIKYAYQHGKIVVVASGDEAGPVQDPANCPGALAISAIGIKANIWKNSATGPEIDFAGAGVEGVEETLSQVKLPLNVNGTSQSAAITSGELALIWSKFPKDTARQIITRALWSVSNGVGGGEKANGVRPNNEIGYGWILPTWAFKAMPATAKNPIYDKWEAELGPPTPVTTSPATAAPSSAPPAASSAGPAPSGNANSQSPGATTASSSSSSSIGLIIGIAAAAIVLVVIALFLIRRRRGDGDGPGGTLTPTNQPLPMNQPWPPQPTNAPQWQQPPGLP